MKQIIKVTLLLILISLALGLGYVLPLIYFTLNTADFLLFNG